MKTSCRVQWAPSRVDRSRTRCPIQNPRNSYGSIGPNLIGFRFDLFEHIEIVCMSRFAHALEDADFAARKVRHAEAEHGCESIRTHHSGIPCMGRTPVV